MQVTWRLPHGGISCNHAVVGGSALSPASNRNECMMCAAGAEATGAGDEPTATEFLDRLCSALPESMACTLCWRPSLIAAAARAGRPRGLLGMLALATAEVYSQSAEQAPSPGASTRQGGDSLNLLAATADCQKTNQFASFRWASVGRTE